MEGIPAQYHRENWHEVQNDFGKTLLKNIIPLSQNFSIDDD